MTDVMQIQTLLKGYKVDKDNIQSVGNMTMLPLVSETEFTNVSDINEVVLKDDPSYNQLQFQNAGGSIGIAMQGWTIIDKQAAQDRTIPHAHLIKAMDSKVLPANCIQSNQGGHFNVSNWNQENFMILPPSLRNIALKRNKNHNHSKYSAMWEDLSSWVKTVNCKDHGLKQFYSKYEDKLDQFVAQFEPVVNQLGCIILINDQVMAVDLMPKFSNWKKVWRAFVRDSYGAEAVRQKESGKITVSRPSIETDKVKTLENLEEQYNKAKSDFYDHLQQQAAAAFSFHLTYSVMEAVNELSMLKLEGDQFSGQAVIHGDDHYVYISLTSNSTTPKQRQKFQSLRQDVYPSDGFTFF